MKRRNVRNTTKLKRGNVRNTKKLKRGNVRNTKKLKRVDQNSVSFQCHTSDPYITNSAN